MAELLIKVGTSGGFDDGDIVSAFNDLRITNAHLEHICDIKKAPFNADGLRESVLSEELFKRQFPLKFQRLSERALKATNLATNEFNIYDQIPNANGHSIDLQTFIDHETASQSHRLFGTKGGEYWYGGRQALLSASQADSLWSLVETLLGLSRSDYAFWPLTDYEKKHFLPIGFSDFDAETARNLVAHRVSAQETYIGQRAWQFVYEQNSSFKRSDIIRIRNAARSVDYRESHVFGLSDLNQKA